MYSGCVSIILDIQDAKRMCHFVICALPGSTKFYPLCLIKGTIFKKKSILNIKQLFLFSLRLLSGQFLILRRNEPDMNKSVVGLHVRQVKNYFWTDVQTLVKYQKLRKLAQWEPCCSIHPEGRSNGQTDRQT